MTTKSLQELSELLRSERLAYKKCCNYVSDANDPELKATLGELANNHKLRYETLTNYLNNL